MAIPKLENSTTLSWVADYNRRTLARDLMAAAVVTIMLIPQSLAYASLAGLPPQMGLYASIAPLIVYAIFGTSRTMAVGPVAVISLMIASAASQVAPEGSVLYIQAAYLLALISGGIMLGMGLLRLGALARLLSSPVVNGFTLASSIIIVGSQIGPLIGVKTHGQTLWAIGAGLLAHLMGFNRPTALIGVAALASLSWVRNGLMPLLIAKGVKADVAGLLVKASPVLVIIVTTLTVRAFDLSALGVATVGAIPRGLPSLTSPPRLGVLWLQMTPPALFISIIGFVSSISVAQALAARRLQQIGPSQELVGLGVANIAAALTGGFPIAGGFARSVVNFDAGAETPAAGAFTAVGLSIAAMGLTSLLFDLPIAALSAMVIVASLSMIDFGELEGVWRYSKQDFVAMAATIAATLAISVEVGLATGVIMSILLNLQRSATPHCAIVGQVPGTHHFRNVDRHRVITSPNLVTLRIDENLSFANAAWLECKVMKIVTHRPATRHVVLMCSAVNNIDASALKMLLSLNRRLSDSLVMLHLSEVKGPVMDRLQRTTFTQVLNGSVFMSQYDAFQHLSAGERHFGHLDFPENIGGAGI